MSQMHLSDDMRRSRPKSPPHWVTALLLVLAIRTTLCPDSVFAEGRGIVSDQQDQTIIDAAPIWDPNLVNSASDVEAFPTAIARLPGLGGVQDPTPRNRAMELVQRSDDDAVRRYRKSFLQRLRLSGGWIGQGGESGLGITSWNVAATLAVPLGSFENLLLVTPGLQVDYLDGPTQIDAPDRLYYAGLDLMWRKQWNDRWGSMIAVAPAVASDFQSTDDALRVTGRAFATWQWVPERLTLLFGVVYLDRDDLAILPGVGLIWTPTPDYRLDVIFPRPKLARRLVFVPREREDWVYLSGKLGGRTWAVERESGLPDQLTLRDYRLDLGWERIIDGGSGVFAEIGYVFGRELEYESTSTGISFDDAVMIRGGITY